MSVPPENQPSPAQPAITDPHHLLPAHASEDASSTKSGYRKWIVLLVVALIVGVIVWRILESKKADQATAQKAAAAANRPVPVQFVPVQVKTVPVFLSALGTVTAYNTVTLQARVSGQLLSVNFTEGQNVHKGQLLLQIDPRPYQAALDQAIGTLAKDEANLKNMNAEAQRYSALYEAGVISKESQQLQVSNAGQAQGTIKSDQAAIEAARVNLGYTKIYSPIDGVVGLRQVDPGNIVNAGGTTGLVVITQIHPIAVVFTLPEDQLPLVQTAMKGGNKLVVEAYDRSDAHKIAAGTLLTIDNQIDTTTGTAKLKAVFENADNALFANQFVNVRLILRQRQNATVIPTAAIQSGTQGDYVFVVNDGPTPQDKLKNQPNNGSSTGDGKSKKSAAGGTDGAAGTHGDADGANKPKFHVDTVPVHVDFVIGTSSILSDGELQPGQKVVVDGQEKLVDGGNVQPQPAKTAAPQPTQSGVGAGATPSTPSQTSGSDGVTTGQGGVVPGKGKRAHDGSGPGSTVSNGSSNGNGGGNQ
jgi:multidrug efflux system membrane fusion protein